MQIRTAAVVVPASKDAVFEYVSDIHNLPAWANEFCRELKNVDGTYKVVTGGPTGETELFARYEADRHTGVIDMYAGPTPDEQTLFPTRVVALPEARSVFTFTMVQNPNESDEAFAAQFASLQRELKNIQATFQT